MRLFTLSNYATTGSGSYGRITKALLLCMAMVLFQFTQSYAQEATEEAPGVYLGDGDPNAGSHDIEWQSTILVNSSLGDRANVEPIDNPNLDEAVTCTTLRTVLLLDESGSILNRDGVEDVRQSTLGLAEVFLGSPAFLTIIEFGSESNVILGPSTVDAQFMENLEDYLYGEYNGQSYDPNSIGINLPCFLKYTNWESGLETSLFEADPNLLLFLTDGEPSAYNVDPNNPDDVANDTDNCGFIAGGGQTIGGIGLDRAITASNLLKSNGTHIFGIGVGNGVQVNNLKLVSGNENFADNPDIFTADYSVGDFENLEANLAAGINAICGTPLAITKSVDFDQVCGDETITFTLTVANAGPVGGFDALGVVLTDVFPDDYTIVGIVEDPIVGTAEITDQTLTYTVGDLAPEESVTIQVQVTLAGAAIGDYPNTAFANATNANEVSAEQNVAVTNLVTTTEDVAGCESYELIASNFVAFPDADQDEDFNTAGEETRVITGLNENGCETEVTVNITVNEPSGTSETVTECGSYTWPVNGVTYNTVGTNTYTDITPGVDGECDFTATLELTILNAEQATQYITSCGTDPVVIDFFGFEYESTGFYTETFDAGQECDFTLNYYISIGEANIGAPCYLDGSTELNGVIEESPEGECGCVPQVFECPDLEANIGDACDDGDAGTENDMVSADCECEGTIIYDCPALSLNIGDACDDGDAGTENDMVSADCECEGTIIYDCPALSLNIGDACDDGDAGTENDMVSADCECEGTIIYDCPALSLNIGDACDDGDAGTENDMVSADCECEGTIIYDCPALSLNIGDACDDGDAGTENDMVSADCECEGTIIYDCPALSLNIGDACDDGNDMTENDLVGSDCLCAGTPIVIYDCPELEANIGDACDDGDANTNGDVIVEDCGCVGSPINPGTDCENFKLYYIASGTPGVAAGTVFEGVISGGNVQLTELFQSGLNGHMALNTDNGNIYVIEGNGSRIRTFSPDGDFISEVLLSGLSRTYAMAYDPSDSKLYVGSANANKVYKLDPETGDHIVFAEDVPVEGGDIVVDGDQVYLIERRDNAGSRLYNITSGDDVFVSNIVSAVNGAAQTANGGLIAAEGAGSSSFWTYDFDGSNEQELMAIDAGGDSFMLVDGDMASGCNSGNNNEDGCGYELYYTHVASGNGSADGLYSVTLNDDNTSDEVFITAEGDNHIALSPDGSLIYMVGGSNIFTFDVITQAITSVNIFNGANNANLSGFPTAVADADGNVFIGGAGNNVWQVNPQTGEAFLIASGISVNGGDLIVAPTGEDGMDELWIITRNNNRFTRVLDPSNGSFTVDVPEINGAAVLENGNVLLANGDGSNEFVEVSLQDDITFGSIVSSYLSDLPLFNGDLAGGCTNSDNLDICDGDNGNCYGTVDAYVRGTRSNGGAISESRADTSNASGMPERTDNLVFTTLGYGGSIVFKFQGIVPNGPGDDIEVVETSFNTLGCEAYPEYAVVSVSQDDITYYTLQTICKGEPFADISNAVDANGAPVELDCVMYVKVENEDNLTTTPDGFDVDGIVAIHNCDDNGDGAEVEQSVLASSNQNILSSYPNPTTGSSQVVFVTGETTRTTLEVYDMNGRNVATLFNQVANANQEYRIEFDGTELPNGIYIHRLTTSRETIIDKFMLVK